MNIRVQVFGELVEYLKSSEGGRLMVEVPDGAVVETLMEKLGLSPGYVGVVLVNGKFSNKDVLLKHNDQVQIIPQLEGG